MSWRHLHEHALSLFSLCVIATAAMGQNESPASASEGIDRGEPIVLGHRIEVPSDQFEEPRWVRVALPPHYEEQSSSCCVLYLLDGDTLFVQATGILRHLGPFEAPPVIVVGIDSTERTRDLTFPASSKNSLERFPSGGGSATFRRFLVDELKPFVEARYRTNGIDLLAGHSFGGLFTAETALVEPEAFDAYFALSPSLWWDDASLVSRLEEVQLDHGLFQSFAWFAMGDEGAGMNPHFEAVTWSLRDRAPAGFRWGRRHFPGHDHWSVALPSLNEGLRAYFEPIRTLGKDAMGFADFQRAFARVRAEFGEAVTMTAGPIVRRARELSEQGQVEPSLDILVGAAIELPTEPLLHYVRGEILAGASRKKEAASVLQAAIERFEEQPEHAEGVAWLRRFLRDLEKP